MSAFDHALDVYQAGLYETAEEARARSYETAARPEADAVRVCFRDLRVGDYMTNEGPSGRWVKVIEIRDVVASIPDGLLDVLFEIPEPVTVSGETRYWIKRASSESVWVDRTARAGFPATP